MSIFLPLVHLADSYRRQKDGPSLDDWRMCSFSFAAQSQDQDILFIYVHLRLTPTSPGNVVRKSHLSKTLSSGWVLLRSLGGHEDRWCRSPARQIVRVEVQNGRVVKCGHRDTATDPRGPQGLNPVGRLVARGEAAGGGFGRRRCGRATTTSNLGIARKSIPSVCQRLG